MPSGTDLEKLVLQLEANLSGYQRELAKAQGMTVSKLRQIEKQATASATRFEAAWKRAGAGIRGGIAGALSAVTIGAVVGQLDRLVKKFAEVSDQAARAGVSAEFLQAVNLAGISAGADEMTALLQKFNQEIGEAATKGNYLAEILKANNVPLRDANGQIRTTEELFFDVVELIKNARTQQEASVIAMEAFGKGVKDTLPFLMQGAAAIKTGMQAAEDAGGVVNDELVKAADEFADRWNYAWAVWEGQAARRVLTVLNLMDSLMGRAEKFFAAGDSAAVSLYKAATGAALPDSNVSQFDLMMSGASGQSVNSGAKSNFTVLPPAKSGAAKAIRDAAKDTSTDLEDMLDSMVEVDQGFLEMQEDAQQLHDAFKGAFSGLVDAAADGKLKISELIDVLGDLRARLMQMAADKAFDMFFGNPQNGTSGILGSLLSLPGMASGGAVKAGQPYMVGERGRELFVPQQDGAIIPNNALGGGMSITINDNVGAQVSARQTGSGSRRGYEIDIDARFAQSAANTNSPLNRVLNSRGARAGIKRR